MDDPFLCCLINRDNGLSQSGSGAFSAFIGDLGLNFLDKCFYFGLYGFIPECLCFCLSGPFDGRLVLFDY